METNDGKEKMGRKRKEAYEKSLNQGDTEETREEMEHEERNEGEENEENKVIVSEKELMEEQLKPERSLEAEEEMAQDVQMEDKETEISKETIFDKQQSKNQKVTEKKNEPKKSRRRRGKKQNDHVRTRQGGKEEVGEKLEEEKKSQTQEISVMSSEENSTQFEASVGLISSCELSDPVYLGIGATGLYAPPVPVPVLFPSQPPGPIQSTAPQSHGTKRPHSPSEPPSLPQQSAHPLQVKYYFSNLSSNFKNKPLHISFF